MLDEFKVSGIFYVRYCFAEFMYVSLSQKMKILLGDKFVKKLQEETLYK